MLWYSLPCLNVLVSLPKWDGKLAAVWKGTIQLTTTFVIGADLLSYPAATVTMAVFASVALLWPLAVAFPLLPCTWLAFRRTAKVTQAVQSSGGPQHGDAEMGLPTPEAVYPRVPAELDGDQPFAELGPVAKPAGHK